jgi:hypothetical protein
MAQQIEHGVIVHVFWLNVEKWEGLRRTGLTRQAAAFDSGSNVI